MKRLRKTEAMMPNLVLSHLERPSEGPKEELPASLDHLRLQKEILLEEAYGIIS